MTNITANDFRALAEAMTYPDETDTPKGKESTLTYTFRDTKTGREATDSIRVCYDASNDVYWLTEGNFGCDCNRAAVLGIEDYPCGYGRFELVRADRDGFVIWADGVDYAAWWDSFGRGPDTSWTPVWIMVS